MEAIADEIIQSPAVTKAIVIVLFSITITITVFYFQRVLNGIKYLTIFVKASDKACEKHMGNGYAETRDKELKKSFEEEGFINRKIFK